MKIRSGFVSNSSSSSFIINFPEEITSKELLAEYAYKPSSKCNEAATFDEAIEWIFNNMQPRFTKKPDYENIVSYLLGLHYKEDDDITHFQNCHVGNMTDFCREFDISVEDQMHKSPFELVTSAINSTNNGNKKFYIVETWDDGEEFIADLQYGRLERMFPDRIERF